MAPKKHLDKLPRFIGVMADSQFPHRAIVQKLILGLRTKSVVVTTESRSINEFIERTAILRGDLYVKSFITDPWESAVMSRTKAEAVRDYLFISYLRYHGGHLFLFARKYDVSPHESKYSKRMQELLLMAYQLKVPYDIIHEDDKDLMYEVELQDELLSAGD